MHSRDALSIHIEFPLYIRVLFYLILKHDNDFFWITSPKAKCSWNSEKKCETEFLKLFSNGAASIRQKLVLIPFRYNLSHLAILCLEDLQHVLFQKKKSFWKNRSDDRKYIFWSEQFEIDQNAQNAFINTVSTLGENYVLKKVTCYFTILF